MDHGVTHTGRSLRDPDDIPGRRQGNGCETAVDSGVLGARRVKSKGTLTHEPPMPALMASPVESHNPAGTPGGQETNGTKTQKDIWGGYK